MLIPVARSKPGKALYEYNNQSYNKLEVPGYHNFHDTDGSISLRTLKAASQAPAGAERTSLYLRPLFYAGVVQCSG